MEKKTTRRIIGVLVVIALVIILLPLMFNGNDAQAPIKTAEVTAPPFPDSTTTTKPEAVADNSDTQAPYQTMMKKILPATPAATTDTPAKTTVASTTTETTNPAKTAAASTTTDATKTTAANTPATTTPAKNTTIKIATKSKNKSNSAVKIQEASLKKSPHKALSEIPDVIGFSINNDGQANSDAAKTTTNNTVALDNTADLASLKKLAWVVQLGSFRDKNNAKRLTDALRAKGYKAFTYETKSNGQTRVYVGPTGKQLAASTLASQIQQEMNMQGIIVSYKPLEL